MVVVLNWTRLEAVCPKNGGRLWIPKVGADDEDTEPATRVKRRTTKSTVAAAGVDPALGVNAVTRKATVWPGKMSFAEVLLLNGVFVIGSNPLVSMTKGFVPA